MSGKICPSLSIHHKVTRINFDRVAKALAVLLGYPGHGNKKNIVDIGTRGIFLGGDRIKRKEKRIQHGETTLERHHDGKIPRAIEPWPCYAHGW